MTIEEILAEIKPFKPLKRSGLYPHLKALHIRPIGVRQIPQQYPDDVAKRILLRLGVKKLTAPAKANGRTPHPRRERRQISHAR